MSQANQGKTVKVHYTGKLDDGKVFDTSRERDPLEFTIGEGRVIPGFETGVMGMEVGQTTTIKVPPDQGYGPRRDDLVVEVPKADFPENITPEKGLPLQVKQPDDTVVNVVVSEVRDETVILDANHPLAGETLTFEIELLEVA